MNDIELLKQQVAELMEWKKQREFQQLSYPVDQSSKNALGAVIFNGPGSTAKTQTYTDSRGDTVTAPKAYVQTIIIEANGTQYEIPSIT